MAMNLERLRERLVGLPDEQLLALFDGVLPADAGAQQQQAAEAGPVPELRPQAGNVPVPDVADAAVMPAVGGNNGAVAPGGAVDAPAAAACPAVHAEALLRAAEESAVELARAREQLLDARRINDVSAKASKAHRGKLPPLKKWDGKCPGRKADTFLDDVECYADYDMQERTRALQLYLEGMVREGWEMVKKRWNGVQPAWPEVRLQFKRMVGQQYDITADIVRRDMIDHKLTQKGAHSVTDFRVEFESKLVYVNDVSEAMAAAYFVAGLKPSLKALCQTDATGKAFATLNDAAEFAVGKERELALHNSGRVAAVQGNAGFGGRGSGGRTSGRGGRTSGRGGYRPPPPYTGNKRPRGGPYPPRRDQLICYNCGRPGHRAADCTQPRSGGGSGGAGAAAPAVVV